jgi:hypothetical protein
MATAASPTLAADREDCFNGLMPSPVGHALGGLIAGWLTTRAVSEAHPRPWPVPHRHHTVLFATLALAPDLDLLFGTHSTYTHSIGAVLIVWLAALAVTRGRRLRLALACAAAWSSHLLFDWLGADSTPPLGIMALWPFTDRFYQSPVPVFAAISRRYWQADFYTQNTVAVLKELLILGPPALAAWWWRGRTV